MFIVIKYFFLKKETLLYLKSYVWNHMVSERISLYGNSVVVGDLVISDDIIKNDDNEQVDILFGEGEDEIVEVKKKIIFILKKYFLFFLLQGI